MRAADGRRAFEELLAAREIDIRLLDAASAVEAMLDFYLDVRADDVNVHEDGDMLLFQWGIDSGSFQYDITRQFISGAGCDDDAFRQLSLTLHYDADARAEGIGTGNRWCRRPQSADSDTVRPAFGDIGVEAFRDYIAASPATAYAGERPPRRVEISFGGV